MAKKMLMLLSIGSVQGFIARARKLCDVSFGSHILSDISKEAVRCLMEEYGARFIFPSIDRGKSTAAAPDLRISNKILAVVETDDVKWVALQVRRAVARKWLSYADQAKERLKGCIIGPMWERQVKDFIEFYAVWVEMKSEADYPDALERAEQLMSARKTLRDFRPNRPANLYGDLKSSLDPGKESVLRPNRFNLYARYGIKRKETLDAISLVKRMARFIGEKKECLSVCDIAFHRFRDKLDHPQFAVSKEKVDQYYKSIRLILQEKGVVLPGDTLQTYDSRMFYVHRVEEGISELIGEQSEPAPLLSEEDKQELTLQIQAELDKLYQVIGAKPSSCYTLVVGDGDRVGSNFRSMTTMEQHESFSEHLSAFASTVEDTIIDHRGQLIYSGGDDFIALLPVDRCLEAIGAVHHHFTDRMKKALPHAARRPTLSIGIAVVHMLEPLEDSLQVAKAVQKLAKKRRDELAIHFQKGSGSNEIKVSLPFADAPVDMLLKFAYLYQEGYISTSFAYGLQELYQLYEHIQSDEYLQPHHLGETLFLEVQRMMRKKKSDFFDIQTLEKELLPIFVRLRDSDPERGIHPLHILKQRVEQCIAAMNFVKAGEGSGSYCAD